MTVLLTAVYLATLAALGAGAWVVVHRLYGLLERAQRIAEGARL